MDERPAIFFTMLEHALRLLTLIMQRPAGLYRALSKAVFYLEHVAVGLLAAIVAWDGLAEAAKQGPTPRAVRRPAPGTAQDPWDRLILRTFRLISILTNATAAKRRLARRVARGPHLAARLIARGERASARPAPEALFRLPPLPPETDPNSS